MLRGKKHFHGNFNARDKSRLAAGALQPTLSDQVADVHLEPTIYPLKLHNLILRHTVPVLFLAGTLLISLGLWLAASRGVAAASGPANSTLMFLLVCGAVYGAGHVFLPEVSMRPLSDDTRRLIWWTMFGWMIVACVVFVWCIPTTASIELAKRLIYPGYQPSSDEMSIRLSTVFMPLWAQALFEMARRIAAVYCIVEFFFSDLFKRNRLSIGAGLIAILAFFVLSTLDRVIPVLYFATAIIAILFTVRLKAYRRPAIYLNAVAILLSIGVLRQVQYGEFKPVDFEVNTEIAQVFGSPASPAASPANPVRQVENALSCGGEALPTAIRYAHYSLCSAAQRIILSPLTMIVYAAEHYDARTYLHWSTTRIFSVFGYGRYVDPLEQSARKHHDAFPVTFVGDLWRNGGPAYFIPFAAFMGVVLLLINRFIFMRGGLFVPQILAVFGTAFLFYGNAFNVTSWAFIIFAFSLALPPLFARFDVGD